MSVLRQMAKTQNLANAKTEKPKFDTSVTAWLDRSMRGLYAVANTIKDGVDGGDFTPFESFWDGLSGEEKTMFGDVMDEMGWRPSNKPEEVLKFIVGLTGDILLDPITYISPFGLTKLGRIAQKTGKLAPTIATQSKIGQRALLTVGGRKLVGGKLALEGVSSAAENLRKLPAVQKLRAVFPNIKPPKVSAAQWKEFQVAKYRATNLIKQLGGEAEDFSVGIQKKLKNIGVDATTNNEMMAQITHALENRTLAKQLPDNIKPIYEELLENIDKHHATRKQMGKSVIEDADYNVVKKMLTPEAQEFLKKNKHWNNTFREWTTHTTSDYRRKWFKFVDIDSRGEKWNVSTARQMKLYPFKIEGMSRQHLQEILEDTALGLRDLQVMGEVYGFKPVIDKRVKQIVSNSGGKKVMANAIWNPNKRILRVAGKGKSEYNILQDAIHEATHFIHQELGGRGALSKRTWMQYSPMRQVGEKYANYVNRRNAYVKTIAQIDKIPKKERVAIHLNTVKDLYKRYLGKSEKEALAMARESINGTLDVSKIPKAVDSMIRKRLYRYAKRGYVMDGSETMAFFSEIYAKNPKQAAKDFPRLAKIYGQMLDSLGGKQMDGLLEHFRRARNGFSDMNKHPLFRDRKGKLYAARQATIEEQNNAFIDLFREKGVEGVPSQFFSTNLPYITYAMGKEQARAKGAHEFFNMIKQSSAMAMDYTDDAMKEGWKLIDNIPELKGIAMPEDLAKEVEKVRKAFIGEEATKDFLRMYDKIQNTWKLWTLGPFPAYHFRNIIGNTWNNYLAGVTNPVDMNIARRMQTKVAKGKPLSKVKNIPIKAYKPVKGKSGFRMKTKQIIKNVSEEDIWTYAQREGVMGRGLMSADIPGLEALTERTLGAKLGAPAIKGLKFGGHIEDNARLWHFIDKMKKGYSWEEAGLSVKKYLFDYGELTQFEKNVLKRLMPFYTWTRKNIPLQLESLVKTPGRTMIIEKARQESMKRIGANNVDDLLPEWVAERMPFITGKDGEDISYFPIESWLPFGDIMKVSPGRAKELMGELLSPIIKVPIELAQNKVWYFNSPIEDYPGETEEFLRQDMPAWMAYMGRQVRVLNEIHRLVGFKRSEDSDIPQPSIPERLVRTGTGIRVFRTNINRAVNIKRSELMENIKALNIGLSRAKKFAREEEYDRISRRLKEYKQALKSMGRKR